MRGALRSSLLTILVAVAIAPRAMGQTECGRSDTERARTVGDLLRAAPDSTHGPVAEVKFGDFEHYGPGLLIAIDDSAMTMADSASQANTARPVAVFAVGYIADAEACRIILVGWRKQMTRNAHYTIHVPFRVSELLDR